MTDFLSVVGVIAGAFLGFAWLTAFPTIGVLWLLGFLP